MNTTIKTSGKMEDFGSGAKRDARDGKGRYDLISCHALMTLASERVDVTLGGQSEHIWRAVISLAQWGLTRYSLTLTHALDSLCRAVIDEQAVEPETGMFYPLASRLEEGAKHYGERNWQNGMPLSHLYDSTMRHLDQLLSGLADENHLGAAMFGVMALLDHEARLTAGEKFASDVDDWPVPITKENV